jgi:hypothetical protein
MLFLVITALNLMIFRSQAFTLELREVRPTSLIAETFGSHLTPPQKSPLNKVTSWNPRERSLRFPILEECSPYGFTRRLQAFSAGAHHERAAWLQKTLEICGKTPSFLSQNRFLTSFTSNDVHLELSEIPGIKQYHARSKTLESTRFLASLKRGRKPAVLIVCGTGCNLLEGPAKSLFAWVHATTDAHIFLLGSASGSDSIQDNHRFVLGGAEEGANIFNLVSLINASPEFAGRISEWHVLGMSLGGHSALYSGIYFSQKSLE